jgi:hypothetical protein
MHMRIVPRSRTEASKAGGRPKGDYCAPMGSREEREVGTWAILTRTHEMLAGKGRDGDFAPWLRSHGIPRTLA